ncbi:MAG: beta strand repeat-containing protein [Dehalococcoidia bacterium]
MRREHDRALTRPNTMTALFAGLLLLAAWLAVASTASVQAAGEPSINSIFPAQGPAAGGNAVQIAGEGFTSATAVTFGGVAALSWTVNGWAANGETTITAIAPPGVAGASVQVRVFNPAGGSTSGVFYQYLGIVPPPAVTGVTPDAGPTSGGTVVTISGSNFSGATAVRFGSVASPDWDVISSTTIIAVSPAHVAGTVDVTVTAPGGTSPASAGSDFTYSGTVPAVTGLSPAFGPPAGGNTVIITGVNLGSATAVRFDGVATAFVVNSSTSISATAPAHAAGTISVLVQTPAGTSAPGAASDYTYTTDPVVVTSLTPATGPVGGGTAVTVKGYGFTGASAVKFGALHAAGYTVVNDTTIVAYAPAQGPGSVYVRVTVGAFTSATGSASLYTYGATGPVVTSLIPSTGPTTGGTVVTIYGSGFTGTTAVAFGSLAAGFSVVSDTTLIVVAPAQAAGSVHVLVTNALGTSVANAASLYTYTGTGPVVTSLSPASGPTSGGTIVVITGTGFTAATSVSFGGTAAASFVVNSGTSITAVAPARSTGTVYVVVTTASGSSPQTAPSQFTYAGTPGTISYTLTFRWTLLTWMGIDGLAVDAAVKGLESPDVAATNDVSGRVTAIFFWDSTNQRWLAWFPNASNVPGANDFTTLRKGQVYFFAINGAGSTTWVVIGG